MPTVNILFKRQYAINDKINIRIPTVREILEHEDSYYEAITIFTAMPIDLMVQLDDAGIDFTAINEYELFLLLFESLRHKDLSLVFAGLSLEGFQPVINKENDTVILVDNKSGTIIDREIHAQIAAVLRKIHHIQKDNRRPANEEAKAFMIKRARDKLRRHNNRKTDSNLESLIVALVNTEQFHYGFEGTQRLTIYQFNESVRQVIKKIDYDNKMRGIYAGTVSAKDLNPDDLNWLIHK